MDTAVSEKERRPAGENSLRQILDCAEQFASPPALLARIIELTGNPNTTVAELEETLATEPVITAKLLRISNSALYARSRTIVSIREAVVVVGFKAIGAMAVSLAANAAYSQAHATAPEVARRMWEHSLATAVLSRMLSTQSGGSNPDSAYVAGLLHDVGKIAMSQTFPGEFSCITDQDELTGRKLLIAEDELFGITHPSVGAALVEQWALPPEVQHAIEEHHHSFALRTLPGVVAISNLLVTKIGYNIHAADPRDDQILAKHKLDAETEFYSDLLESIEEQIGLYD